MEATLAAFAGAAGALATLLAVVVAIWFGLGLPVAVARGLDALALAWRHAGRAPTGWLILALARAYLLDVLDHGGPIAIARSPYDDRRLDGLAVACWAGSGAALILRADLERAGLAPRAVLARR